MNSNNGHKSDLSVHTFVDASSIAYGAVVYIKTSDDKNISVSMVAAKGRVTPLQSLSTLRLELLGALTGLRLTQVVCKALGILIESSTFWSDSMNVLF